MKVIRSYPEELKAVDMYELTMKQHEKMVSAAGQVLNVAKWALYEAENSRGELGEVLGIVTDDGKVYGTISATFKRDFLDMWDLFQQFGECADKIQVTSGTSKGGREYIGCVYAG